jgi:predicted alpha-1,2-mannosidase
MNLNTFIQTILSFILFIYQNTIYAQNAADYVNPFIGTSNFGATYPGPIAPRGMASISPFNVAGSQNLPLEKDSRWLSNSYVYENTFLTGFTQVNLSGVGCPDLGVLLVMPTTGALETNHLKYGSTYSNEVAKAGYYSSKIDKYDIKAEFTASKRVGISKFTFPKGQSNILLNLGLGLTNEQGAMVKIVSSTEIEGMRSVGSFCYNNPEAAYPVYFVAKFSKPADNFGVWKKPLTYKGVEAQWMGYNGKTRVMDAATKMVVGDSIGTYFTYRFDKIDTVEVKIGVSYVSIENARENLEKETFNKSFDAIYKETYKEWNDLLSRIKVEGGSKEAKTIFYTALYHTLIHPNTLNDFNGEYPEIKTGKIGKTSNTRYTVFSLWDTYRNLHSLMSLVYPEQQSDMVKSMLNIYDESGWLPKWELNATETTTMVGDPAGIVIADTYFRGIKDFDIKKAYEAMLKSADKLENNPLRPGLEDYIKKGYLTTKSTSSGSVSTTQEYNISDYAISQFANELQKKDDYNRFALRSVSYRNLFDKQFNLLRPKNDDGSWYSPFNPNTGANFEKNIGFIEGNSWQYTFMITHDINGLIKLMGGKKEFTKQLQKVFDQRQFDMANEPDIGYPFLFNYVNAKEWKTQKTVNKLIKEHFKNTPDGLPGNEDTGTMSAWIIYAMMGIYPISPVDPLYTLTIPFFDKITINLNNKYYNNEQLIIQKQGVVDGFIDEILLDGRPYKTYFISHENLVNGKNIQFKLK